MAQRVGGRQRVHQPTRTSATQRGGQGRLRDPPLARSVWGSAAIDPHSYRVGVKRCPKLGAADPAAAQAAGESLPLRATRCDRGAAASSRWPSLAHRRGAAATRTQPEGDGLIEARQRRGAAEGKLSGLVSGRRSPDSTGSPAGIPDRSQPAQRVFNRRACGNRQPKKPSAIGEAPGDRVVVDRVGGQA